MQFIKKFSAPNLKKKNSLKKIHPLKNCHELIKRSYLIIIEINDKKSIVI